jgi:hypothetical protein
VLPLLDAVGSPATMAMAGRRFFEFVIGGPSHRCHEASRDPRSSSVKIQFGQWPRREAIPSVKMLLEPRAIGSLFAASLLLAASACKSSSGPPPSDGGSHPDAGGMGGPDASSSDAGSSDAGSSDGGSSDAGSADAGPQLYVYGPVPGLVASDEYAIRVRLVGSPTWQDAFALITRAPAGTCAPVPSACVFDGGYFQILSNWSNTYTNFEMNGPTEVEISKVSGASILKAAAHPASKAASVTLDGGNAYVVLNAPCQVAVDIDGQMDDQDTGLGPSGVYNGPPINTVTIFANPVLNPRPSPTDPNTYAVQPGVTPPSYGNWTTLYFLPGVHDVGLAFPVHAGLNYYIPGDAIVYGTFSNDNGDAGVICGDGGCVVPNAWNDGHDIHITGYGTLSGQRITQPRYVQPPPADFNQYHPINIEGAYNTSVEGITIADSAYHSVMLYTNYQPSTPTDVKWVKIFTWRVNGDGVNPFGNGRIEDTFIRTQDDASYVSGRGTSRMVCWNDANGACLVFSDLPNSAVTVDDVDVIYERRAWNTGEGGHIFSMRGLGAGDCGNGVVFSNIQLEDTRPTLSAFFLLMGPDPNYPGTIDARDAGTLSGVVFQNVSLAAPSVVGDPNILWGTAIAPITDLTFDNLTVAGTHVVDAGFFTTNSYVTDLNFQ